MIGPFVKLRNGAVATFEGLRYKKAVFNGAIVEGYFVLEDGRLVSDKNSKGWYLKEMKTNLQGTRQLPDMMYPGLHIRIEGKTVCLRIHRIVCETYVSKPKPAGISKEIWNNTHEEVKSLVYQNMLVNHIDHNKMNFHPSNLEWVTAKQNAQKYQAHKRAA